VILGTDEDCIVPEEISIRAAVTGDHGILASLSAVVQQLHVGERPDVFKRVDVGGLEQWFADTLAAGSAKIWIAQVGDTPAGYALIVDQRRSENVFCYQRRWHEVEQIGVLPKYRRHGIARALLRHVIESAAAEGVSEIELNTWSFNKIAHLSFQRLGFITKNVRFERRSRKRGGHDGEASTLRD
jgi:ribosomal protein S18 acetylase RimI-like enzyme